MNIVYFYNHYIILFVERMISMPKSAEELKERLQKVSQEKNLGKLTYKIQETDPGILEMLLNFENFKKAGNFNFLKISTQARELLEDLTDYFESLISLGPDEGSSTLTEREGDFCGVMFPVRDLTKVENAAKKLTDGF